MLFAAIFQINIHYIIHVLEITKRFKYVIILNRLVYYKIVRKKKEKKEYIPKSLADFNNFISCVKEMRNYIIYLFQRISSWTTNQFVIPIIKTSILLLELINLTTN